MRIVKTNLDWPCVTVDMAGVKYHRQAVGGNWLVACAVERADVRYHRPLEGGNWHLVGGAKVTAVGCCSFPITFGGRNMG